MGFSPIGILGFSCPYFNWGGGRLCSPHYPGLENLTTSLRNLYHAVKFMAVGKLEIGGCQYYFGGYNLFPGHFHLGIWKFQRHGLHVF